MRIAHSFQALFAVLGLTAVVVVADQVSSHEHFNETLTHGKRTRRSPHKRHHREDWYEQDQFYKHDIALLHAGEHLSPRQNQQLLKTETRNNRSAVECCPAVLEMIEPVGGKNQEGRYVELYRYGDYKQRFYELSCHKDIKNKPCRFMDKKLHEHSKCVQKYSYTYALVKDPGGHRAKNFPKFPDGNSGEWTLDYIRVRSGCGCVVTPNAKKKRNHSHNRHKLLKNLNMNNNNSNEADTSSVGSDGN